MAGGILDKLGGGLFSLFSGRDDPEISEAANRNASSDALIASGLATLTSERPGGGATAPLQSIAAGILAGRAQGAETRSEEVEKQKLADLKVAINEQGLDTRDLFLRALEIGDIDSANLLGQLARDEIPSRTQQMTRFKEGVGPEGQGIYRVDSAGNLLNKILDSTPKQSGGQRFGDPTVFRRASDNKDIMGVWDAEANDGRGGIIELPEILPPQSLTAKTAAGLGQVGFVAANALKPYDDVLGTLTTDFASDGKSFFLSTAANFLATDQQQVGMALADTFLNVTVRWLSGAQMTDQERTNYRRAMIPRAGDREFGKRVKALMRDNIAQAMSQGMWKGQATINEDGSLTGDADNLLAWTATAQIEAIQQITEDMRSEGGEGPDFSDLESLAEDRAGLN